LSDGGPSQSVGVGSGAAVAMAPVQAPAEPKPPVHLSFALVLLLPLALLAWFVDHEIAQQTVAQATHQVGGHRLYKVSVGKAALSVRASQSAVYTFNVPVGATNAKVQGHFAATGDSGNDIEVRLFTEAQFTNWKNDHETPALYSSGKVSVGDVAAALPTAGTYYLVFNNKFSWLSAKTIQDNLVLSYVGR